MAARSSTPATPTPSAATSTSTCARSRSTAPCRASDPTRCRPPATAPATPASATRATSRCGSRPRRASRPGRPRGGRAARAGTSSARRWRASTSVAAFDIHGGGLDLIFPHHENEIAQSKAAGDAVRAVLAAQRLGHHERREDEQVARQLACSSARSSQRVRPDRAALLPRRRALPLDDRVLVRGARGERGRLPPHRGLPRARVPRGTRIDGERRRHGALPRRSSPRWTTTSACRRRWPSSTTPCARATPRSPRATSAAARAAAPSGARDAGRARRRPVRRALGGGRPRRRRAPARCGRPPRGRRCSRPAPGARADKDWAAADAIRDQLKNAGIVVDDTSGGSRWSLGDGKDS